MADSVAGMSAMRTLRRAPLTEQEIHDRRWWTLAVLVLSPIIILVGDSSAMWQLIACRPSAFSASFWS